MKFDERTRRFQQGLEAADAEGAILFPSANLTYLTGIDEPPSERHFLLIVPQRGESTLLAPQLAAKEVKSTWLSDVRLWEDGDDPVSILESILELHGVSPDGHLLVDDRLWATFLLEIQSLRPEATFERAGSVLEGLRLCKDDREVATLAAAGALADRVSGMIRERGEAVVGMTERELAREINNLLSDGGGRQPAFETIVAAGEHAGRPHHTPTDRPIESGEPVVLDFGAFLEAEGDSTDAAYPGDQTRTMVFGREPSKAYQRIHEIVCEAQQTAIDAIEPGVTAGAIDTTAREVIEQAGYSDAFVHRTGHGVGLEVHEPPYIVEGNDRPLEPGMVFSIEPGIYSEAYGVRIEDLVVVTEDGCDRLNDSPRTWKTGPQSVDQ